MGTLRILTLEHGDRAVVWDVEQEEQVKEAQKEFDDRMSEGYRAYEFPSKNAEGQATKTFDPAAHEIIVTARHGFAGG